MSDLLKKGDIVVVSSSGYTPEYLARVTRTTASTVWVGQKNGNGMIYETRFRPSGREVGQSFHPSYIRKATADDIARIKDDQKRARLTAAIKRVDFATLSMTQLEAAHDILCPKAAEVAESEEK